MAEPVTIELGATGSFEDWARVIRDRVEKIESDHLEKLKQNSNESKSHLKNIFTVAEKEHQTNLKIYETMSKVLDGINKLNGTTSNAVSEARKHADQQLRQIQEQVQQSKNQLRELQNQTKTIERNTTVTAGAISHPAAQAVLREQHAAASAQKEAAEAQINSSNLASDSAEESASASTAAREASEKISERSSEVTTPTMTPESQVATISARADSIPTMEESGQIQPSVTDEAKSMVGDLLGGIDLKTALIGGAAVGAGALGLRSLLRPRGGAGDDDSPDAAAGTLSRSLSGLSDLTEKIYDTTGAMSRGNAGEMLGAAGVGGVLGLVMGMFQKNTDEVAQQFNKITSIGIAQSFEVFSQTAVEAGLTVGQLEEAMTNAGEAARLLGTRDFAMMTKEVRDLTRDMGFYGMTMEEINEYSSKYLELQKGTGLLADLDEEKQAIATQQYIKNITELSAVTGKRRDQIAEETQQAADETALRLVMARMSAEERQIVETQLQAAQQMGFGDAFKQQLVSGAAEFSQAFVETSAILGPEVTEGFKSLMDRIRTEGLTSAEAQAEMGEIMRSIGSTVTDHAALMFQRGGISEESLQPFISAVDSSSERLNEQRESFESMTEATRNAVTFQERFIEATKEAREASVDMAASFSQGSAVITAGTSLITEGFNQLGGNELIEKMTEMVAQGLQATAGAVGQAETVVTETGENIREGARPSRRFGGITTGPETGYLATLHGTEAVIPMPSGKLPLDLNLEVGGLGEFNAAVDNALTAMAMAAPDSGNLMSGNMSRIPQADMMVYDELIRRQERERETSLLNEETMISLVETQSKMVELLQQIVAGNSEVQSQTKKLYEAAERTNSQLQTVANAVENSSRRITGAVQTP